MSYLGRGDYHGTNFLPKRFTNFLGEFLNGKRHGDGLFTYSNKDIYSGQWKNGKKHGNGTYIFAKKGGDMKVLHFFKKVIHFQLKGRWDEGQLQCGKWIMFNNDFYKGEFSHNKPNGKGEWQMHNGNIITGHYTQEKLPKDEELDVEEQVQGVIKLKQHWYSDKDVKCAKK